MLITVPPTVDFETANGKLLRLIRIAFLAVFIRRSKLSMFMSDQFDKNFDQIAEGDDFEDQVFNLLRDALAEGWLGDLVTKAVAVYAQATAFKNMIDQWFLFADAPAGITGAGPALDLGPRGRMNDLVGRPAAVTIEAPASIGASPKTLLIEAVMNDVHGSVAAEKWLTQLASMRRRVCRIHKQSASAPGTSQIYTGFLVGADLVLTVGRIEDIGGARPGERISAQFDFDMIEGKIQEGPLREVRHAEMFLEGAAVAPTVETLLAADAPVWFALLQLDEMEGARIDQHGKPRGWFDLTDTVSEFKPDSPLFLLHHPLGQFIRMSQAHFLGRETSSRLLFEGETAPGSSGAPLFDQNFKLVGLHEARSAPTSKDRIEKIALRADAIAGVLRGKGRLPQPWIEPVPSPAQE